MKEILELQLRMDEDSRKMFIRELYDLSKRGIDLGIELNKKDVKKIYKELDEIKQEEGKTAEHWADSWESAAKKTEARIKQFGSAIENFSTLQGASVAKGFSKGFLGGMGTEVSQFGKSVSKMGKKSEGATGVLLKGLGPVIGLLGTAVTSLASFVSLLIDSEHTAKMMNKSLLEGGTASSDLGKGFFDVKKSLDVLRDSATDIQNNLKWGTIAADQIEMINAFNSSGLALKKVVDYTASAKDQMSKYMSVTSLALTYSKLLGTSASDMAADSSRFMENFGGGLKYIEEQFASIHKASQDSGYSVKWFYSTVQQATSGMSMYNVRVAESAGMLIKLSRALGQQGGADQLQQLTGKYKNMGYTDKIKKTLITGEGITKKAFVSQKEDSGSEIKKIMESASEDDKETMREAVSMLGLKSKDGGDPDFERMSEKELNKFSSYLQEIGEGALSRKLTAYRSAKEGSSGDVLDMAENLDMLGPQQTLIMEMNAAAAVFGKSIDEVDGLEIAGWENATGQSGEEFRRLKEIATSLEADFSNVQDLAKIAAAEPNSEKGLKARKKIENQFGLYVDEFGRVLDKKGGTEVKSKEDLVVASDERYKNIGAEAMDRNTAMAQRVADNTTDIAKKIDIVIAGFLEKIYHIFEKVWSYLPSVFGEGLGASYEDKQKATEGVRKEEEENTIEMEKLSDDLSKLRMDAVQKTGSERVNIDSQIAEKEKQLEYRKKKGEVFEKKYERISAATTGSALTEAIETNVNEAIGLIKILDPEFKYNEVTSVLDEYVKKSGDNIGLIPEAANILTQQLSDPNANAQEILSESNLSRVLMAVEVKKSEARNQKEKEGRSVTWRGFFEDPQLELGKVLYNTSMTVGELFGDVGELFGIENPSEVKSPRLADDAPMGIKTDDARMRDYRGVQWDRQIEHDSLIQSKVDRKKARKTQVESFAFLEMNAAVLKNPGITSEEQGRIYQNALERINDDIKKFDADLAKKEREKKLAEEKKQLDEQTKAINKGNFENLMKAEFMTEIKDKYGEIQALSEEEQTNMANALGTDRDTFLKSIVQRTTLLGLLDQVNGQEDFIYSPKRGLIPFSDQDTVVGAKPGGPIDKMVGKGGGGNVVINVYGGDEQKLVKVIKKVLEQYGM